MGSRQSSMWTSATNAAAVALSSARLDLRSATPWLREGAFAAEAAQLAEIAEAVDVLPLAASALVKAYSPRADADDQFAEAPAVAWTCCGDACGSVYAPGTTVAEAVVRAGNPISARLSSARGGCAAGPALAEWLGALEASSARRVLDADAYVTAGNARASASLGWHIDDVDVLLVMLRGSKRFRVAGRAVGSAMAVTHRLTAGDAIYVPRLCFHAGGMATEAAESTMLSVALRPHDCGDDCDGADPDATAAVAQWRRARRAVLTRRALQNSWAWAATEAGGAALRSELGGGALGRECGRFLRPARCDLR